MTRRFWVIVHRWAGLYMALFLLVAGLTGSVIAFYAELDGWLNPNRERVAISGPPIDPIELRERARTYADANVRLDQVPLDLKPGRTAGFWLTPLIDPATGSEYPKTQREIIVDPHTGALVRVRYNDVPKPLFPITRENVLDFVYKLHYSLALPGRIGTWLFGIAAIVWTLDCFIGAYLTFPIRRAKHEARPVTLPRTSWFNRWTPAWLVRWRGGAYKLNFDLHRAGGLWVWPMLLVLAWSSVGLKLGDEVYRPVMNAVFDMRPAGAEQPRLPVPMEQPRLGWKEAIERGRTLAAEQGRNLGFEVVAEREITLDREHGVYQYSFKSSADTGRGGGAWLMFDADTGGLRDVHLQDRQRFGPWLHDWLFALHFGAVWGLPMQIFICLMGMAVAMLSGTGAYVWWKKRAARVAHAGREK